MGLISGRETNADIPPGTRVRLKIDAAKVDWGEHGPQARLDHTVLDGEYKGQSFRDWAAIAQPRLDFVKNLRKKEYSDEKIAEILRQRGFKFEEIDEYEEEMGVADGGKLFKVATARFDGDVGRIDSFGSVEELLAALEGGSIVAVTKRRGKDDKYVGLVWDMIYTDPDANFDDIPF